MTMDSCEICGVTNVRIVCDHNHFTGYVRGYLCERCNSWLGVFENNLRKTKQCGRWRYKEWVYKYRAVILRYLKQNKGFLYKRPKRINTTNEYVKGMKRYLTPQQKMFGGMRFKENK